MNRIYKYLIFAAAALMSGTAISCSDFLSKNTGDFAFVEDIDDLDEILVGTGYIASVRTASITGSRAVASWIHVMDDDLTMWRGSNSFYTYWEWFYTFSKTPFRKLQYTSSSNQYEDDVTWSGLYSRINVMNTVLYELERKFPDDKEYDRIKGEALFLRGCAYFYLVNCYAQPYSAGTAATEPGVPIKLTEIVEDREYVRDPVQNVYERVIKDLTDAAACLENVNQPNIYRASTDAANHLLSRVYLYMGDWKNAAKYAQKVIDTKKYALLDLKTLDTSVTGALYGTSPENIFTQGEERVSQTIQVVTDPVNAPKGYGSGYGAGGYFASDDFMNTFKAIPGNEDQQFDDKRLNQMVYCYNKYYPDTKVGYKAGLKYSPYKVGTPNGVVSDWGLFRIAETYLNLAEALAMDKQTTEAAKILSDIYLPTRYAAAPAVPSERGAMIDFIRDQRRKELFVEGHRWFDLRRYAVYPEYPYTKNIEHKWIDMVDVVAVGKYVLKAYSEESKGGYVIPIPSWDISLSEGAMVENVRPLIEIENL